MSAVPSDRHRGTLASSALPLLLGLTAGTRRLAAPWLSPRHLWLLSLILAGSAVRIWLIYRYNPLDHIWSDPQRHWDQGVDVLRQDPMSMIDPIMYQLYIGVLARLTLKLPVLVAFYTSVLSVVGPWLWYRFLRELLTSRTLALTGWALLAWLPSWSVIYSYFMQETLMLPLLGWALWATWRCRRKGDTGSFVVAVLIWVLAGLTRGICIPMAAVAMSWLWFAQAHKIERGVISLLLLVGILGPLSVRSYHATHMLAPHGVAGMVQLYQRSGAREILIDFKREGTQWSYGFTSPGILQRPLEPLSEWQSTRQGSARFSIDLDAGSRSWDEAKASIPWNWSRAMDLAKENLIFLFFSESWPDTNRNRLVGEVNHWLRWVWAPLSLGCLLVSVRMRGLQGERLLPTIILVWLLVQGVLPLAVNEGRYRKPFEGLLIAQCLLLADSLRRSRLLKPASLSEGFGGMTQISRRSFGSFLLVGTLATGLHYAIMYGLLKADLCSVACASASGYALSTLFNYLANARFTFEGRHEHAHSLPRFLVTAVAGLGINQMVLLALTQLGLPVAPSQIVATGCVLGWNYIINAVWSFRSRHSS